MEVDLTRLRYFLAVAEELHFTRAATRLHITPPPLSKQIKVLEREVGGALFERYYHRVRLTPLGESLVEPARRILDEVGSFERIARELTTGAGPLRVGATAYAPTHILGSFESAVERLAAAESVFSIPGSAAEVTAHLVAGHLDLGLIHLPATDTRVDYRVVARYQGGIAVRSDDPLAGRSSVTIEDLKDREVAVDLAAPNPVVQESVVRRLKAKGVERVVAASVTGRGSEIEVVTQARARRLVVLLAYAPETAIGRLFAAPDFAMIPLDDSWEAGELAIAWSVGGPHATHPALRRATDELVAALALLRGA